MGRWPARWPHRVYFLGIGGVAMSGLARMLTSRGIEVRGSDHAIYPPASEMLSESGIEVLTPFDERNLWEDAELVVVGNAISRGNAELERALDAGLSIASMPEVIERLLLPSKRVTAIAGTHGKTTTASLCAWLHSAAGRSPSFMIGGRPGNFSHGAEAGSGDDLILEADEYDSAFFDKGPKFLHYWPQIAVLGNVEYDHADIYADLAAVEWAFSLFMRLLPESGTLIVGADSPSARRIAEQARCRVLSFGKDGAGDLAIVDRREDSAGQTIHFARRGVAEGRFRLALNGEHNALNALAALLAFEAAGGDLLAGAASLESFVGPRRRLEVVFAGNGVTLYDDFAHHPTAVAGTLETMVRLKAPGGRVIACLEPRSNTMVRALVQDALADALARADLVFLGEVDRPGRFSDSERLDVGALVRTLRDRGCCAEGPLSVDLMLQRVLEPLREGDTIVLMSNGAFGGLPERLAAALAERAGS